MLKNITYRREGMQQWLLALALFLSIFTFGGLASSTENGLPKTPLTELAYVQKAVAQKRTVLYGFYGKPVTAFALANTNHQAVLTYNLLVKVCYEALLKSANDHSAANVRFYQKTIPQSFKESVSPTA